MQEPFDLLIRRATLFDGTGSARYVADVAVRDGHIAIISADPLPTGSAKRVIEADGLWLTPGFIDIHNH